MSANARLEYDREQLLNRIRTMEEQIELLDQELLQSNRLATLGVLAGMIAHEFNNLLTPVMSYANLAANRPEDHELVEKALNRTIDGASQVSKIAASILGFIRDDNQLQSCEVNCVVDEALACMARDPEKSGVRVVRRISAGLRVQMRPICLQQVLLNLFINSVQAMKQEGGMLEVTAEHSGEDRVLIRVRDTGPGIHPDLAHKLFEPLASYSPSAPTSGHRKTGLGLAICRRLVEEAGGTISVKSAVSMGTTFTIELAKEPCEGRLSA